MQATITGGKLAISAALEAPRPSASGKTDIVLTQNLKVAGQDGKVYTVAVNVYTKR